MSQLAYLAPNSLSFFEPHVHRHGPPQLLFLSIQPLAMLRSQRNTQISLSYEIEYSQKYDQATINEKDPRLTQILQRKPSMKPARLFLAVPKTHHRCSKFRPQRRFTDYWYWSDVERMAILKHSVRVTSRLRRRPRDQAIFLRSPLEEDDAFVMPTSTAPTLYSRIWGPILDLR